MKVKILYIVALFFLFSCSNDDTLNIEKIKEKQTKVENKQDFTIPLEEAIQNLNNTLDIIEQHEQQNNNGLQRVAKRNREIANIEVIYDTPKSIAGSGGIMKAPSSMGDSLLYVVQFKDNQGGAILSADKRIDGTVLAITEFGNILEKRKSNIDKIKKVYPDFHFYNKEYDDYYVGNMPEGFGNIALDMCKNYIETQFTRLKEDGTIEDVPNDFIYYSTEVKPWEVTKKVSPMLTTLWHQRKPFNDNMEEYRSLKWWPIRIEWEKAPAGCVPVAVAQIMAYHEYPANFTCNGVKINWKGVKKISSVNDEGGATKMDEIAVANLLENIGAWCLTFYTSDFGFTLPIMAKKYMSELGYPNADRKNYYKTKVTIDMLNNGNPVFVAGISGWKDGHAWVVDGYIKREREIQEVKNTKIPMTKKYNKEVVRTWSEAETLVHCNFGWGGKCNGYYNSGIFNLKNGAVEKEWNEGDTGSYDRHYTWSFKTITYDNPNK